MGDANVERVRALLVERAAKGLQTYGVTTERTDLTSTDWLRHLQAELLDAAVYIEALISQSAGVPRELHIVDAPDPDHPSRPPACAVYDAAPQSAERDAVVEAAMDYFILWRGIPPKGGPHPAQRALAKLFETVRALTSKDGA